VAGIFEVSHRREALYDALRKAAGQQEILMPFDILLH
jgi:hypothetical protein